VTKQPLLVTLLAGGTLLSMAAGVSTASYAADVTGKVQGVFYESVQVAPNKYADKVSVTIQTCGTNALATGSYAPGSLSDENALGHLFEHQAHAARATVMKNQYMNSVDGFVTLALDPNNQIIKTTFWGHNWECGQNLDKGSVASAGAGSPAVGGGAAAPAASGGAPASPFGGLGKMRKLGF
jgi:hypothetical protein